MNKWKTVSSTYPLNERWMKIRKDVVELPNGTVLDDYYVYEEGHVVMVVPYTSEGKFKLVKQYKHALGDICIEFPAGFIDKEEEPLDAAKRELEEETGLSCPNLELMKMITNDPSKVVNNIYIYLAKDATPKENRELAQDDTENIEVLEVTFDELHDMVHNDQFNIAGSVTAFYLAAEKLGLLKA